MRLSPIPNAIMNALVKQNSAPGLWLTDRYARKAASGDHLSNYAHRPHFPISPGSDLDNDGLSLVDEHLNNTDPLNGDTDGDLSPDGEEVEKETEPNDPNSSIRVLVAIHRQLFHAIGTEGTPPHWYHTRSYYKWTSAAPGYELLDEDPQVNTLPAFQSLSGNLIGKYEFPPNMPDPPAYWETARLIHAEAGCYIPGQGGEGGASITHQRVWQRGPMPETEALLSPMLKTHSTGYNPVPVSYFVRVLETPIGENYSSNFVDLLPGLSAHSANPQNDPDGDGFFEETEQVHEYLQPLFFQVDHVSPVLEFDTGEISEGWVPLPNNTKLVNLVEKDAAQDRIAHRELMVKIGHDTELAGREVTWTMKELWTRPLAPGQQGPQQPLFRGTWTASATHPNRFEESPLNDTTFTPVNQATAKSTIDPYGYAAIRVNLPPVGFNKARIFIQIANPEDITDPDGDDNEQPFPIIDVEVPAVVVIDPGHGGTSLTDFPDSSWNNAVSPSGVLEKTMALRYGLELRDSLKAQAQDENLNLRVLMTRTTDVSVSGSGRALVAKLNGADSIFIIHFNASAAPHTARGTLEVRRIGGNVNPTQDENFIDDVLDRLVPAMQAFDSQANRRVFYPYDTAVASDANLGNTLALGNPPVYAPIRAGYCEVDFIDLGANTPTDSTDDLVDILLNTGSNAFWVQLAAANAMRDGIIHDLKTQP